MNQNRIDDDFSENGFNVDIPLGNTNDEGEKSNQWDYASSQAVNLGRHLKTHSGEKSNKCNQCDYASFHASDLRRHLKTQTLEKSQTNATSVTNDHVSSQTSNLRSHQ